MTRDPVYAGRMRHAFPSLLLATAAGLLAQPVYACMCPEQNPNAEIGWWGDLVFEAEVLEREWSGSEACLDEEVPLGDYYLLGVSRVWAGAANETVVMYSEVSSCSGVFQKGDVFVMNTNRTEEVLYIPGLCNQWPTAAQAVAKFGEGVAPIDGNEALPACIFIENEPNECKCVTSPKHSRPMSSLVLLLLLRLMPTRRWQKRNDE